MGPIEAAGRTLFVVIWSSIFFGVAYVVVHFIVKFW